MRGNGKAAKQAVSSGKLSAFVKAGSGISSWQDKPLYVDWGEVRDNLLSGAVVAVNREGGSLLFGHTRDNSSYSLVLFYAGDKTSYYFPFTEQGVYDLEVFLTALCDLADTIIDAPM